MFLSHASARHTCNVTSTSQTQRRLLSVLTHGKKGSGDSWFGFHVQVECIKRSKSRGKYSIKPFNK